MFGLALTQPFTLSECPKDQFGYKIDSNNCFQRDRYLDDLSACMAPNNREIDVNFSFDNGPRIVAGRNARAQILDGKLEGVMFNTLGIVNQSQVLEQLTTKYGKPAAVMNPEGQNAYGAKFTSIYATWIFPNLDVTFNSALGRTDQGLVEIRTKKGTVAHQKLLDSFTKDKRPL